MGTTQSTQVKEKSPPGPDASSATDASSSEVYPTPKGNEYDAIDKIAAELPNVIDDESRQQVEDYKQACDNGKGPMVRSLVLVICILLWVQRFDKSLLTQWFVDRTRLPASPQRNTFPYLSVAIKMPRISIEMFVSDLPATSRRTKSWWTARWLTPRAATISPKCS